MVCKDPVPALGKKRGVWRGMTTTCITAFCHYTLLLPLHLYTLLPQPPLLLPGLLPCMGHPIKTTSTTTTTLPSPLSSRLPHILILKFHIWVYNFAKWLIYRLPNPNEYNLIILAICHIICIMTFCNLKQHH